MLIVFLTLNVLAFSGVTHSATIYDQSPLDGGDGFPSFDVEQVADNFSLVTDTEITGITWWGNFFDTSSADKEFNIRFFNDVSGVPAVTSFQDFNVTVSGDNSAGLTDSFSEDVFMFETALSPFDLLANTDYYVSIVSPDDLIEFYWQLSNTTGTNFYRDTTDDANELWVSEDSGDFAFSLQGNQKATVPEPNTVVLFVLAFFALTFYRRTIKI